MIASLLKKNPEYYTIWNHRRLVLRALVEAAAQDDTQPNTPTELIKSDLIFLVPLLKEFPKCYWIWNYRQWLLTLAGEVLSREQTSKLWQQELGLVSMMLERDPRNFHGWGYRRHIIDQLGSVMGANDDAGSTTSTSLVEQEFNYTTQKIRDALANFSALHYRSKLIPRLLDSRNADGQARRKFLEAELDLMQAALIDPFNQSAWFYHQFLMDAINTRTSFVADLSDEEIAGYNRQEMERILEISEDEKTCKWVYQALVEYTQLYRVGGRSTATVQEDVSTWKAELMRLDPLRSGRWQETL